MFAKVVCQVTFLREHGCGHRGLVSGYLRVGDRDVASILGSVHFVLVARREQIFGEAFGTRQAKWLCLGPRLSRGGLISGVLNSGRDRLEPF